MPKGTTYRETGILRRVPLGYALKMDGGGEWMLDVRGSARKLIGKRVTIEGKRMGFDLIFVDRIWCEGRKSRRNWTSRMGVWFVLAISIVQILVQWF
ncbi:DUF5818 domain-containing protein [Parasphingorhabdus sp.]|uniref:DUF5818 domain-containing protein n=1 Tax=Parasphingorhabdus sp. TaxID=2709688 RepID=UPI003D2A899B